MSRDADGLIDGALADGEAVSWRGRSSLARAAWWRSGDLAAGAFLMALGSDCQLVTGPIDFLADGFATHVLGLALTPEADMMSSPLTDLAGLAVNLALLVVGAAFLWRFFAVVDDHGVSRHAVTDRRILQATKGTITSIPLSQVSSVEGEPSRFGGGITIRTANRRKPFVVAGITDVEAAVAAMGRPR